MSRYKVRNLRKEDFGSLMALEEELFDTCDDGVLGPYYVRLCCEFFRDSCFIVEVDGKAIGYLLSFTRDREAYCTTMAMVPQFQGTRATLALVRAFARFLFQRVDSCWFTVEEDNRAARSLHRMLGARDVDLIPDFYGPNRPRIVSKIDRSDVERMASRFKRLGLVEGKDKNEVVACQQKQTSNEHTVTTVS